MSNNPPIEISVQHELHSASIAIRSIRTYLGYNQSEFAKLVGVHVNSLANWETESKKISADAFLDILKKSGFQLKLEAYLETGDEI